MATALLVIIAMVVGGVLGFYLPRMTAAYLKFRGRRLVECPETGETVAVDPDAVHAAVSAATGVMDLRLQSCTRWPGRHNCGQGCLREIRERPDDCLVRNFVRRWYSGKKCVLCQMPIDTPVFSLRNAALRGPDGNTLELRETRSEKIPELLATHQPLCWNCHITEKFRREYPEFAPDRPA